jgi:uncharacterized membrane protein YoaK (UPF0700 family)
MSGGTGMAEARVERSARLTTAVFLLALSSGAVDAMSFAALGAVFASVMTGNLVLLGVAAVHARLGPALTATAAIVAYATGVFGTAAWLHRLRGRHDRRDARRRPGLGRHTRRASPGRRQWAGSVRRALLIVPVAQAGVLAGWLAAGERPDPTARTLLLALSALAMGAQSAGVNTFPLTGAATTYLTGTLTTLTTELAAGGVPVTMRRRLAVLAAALTGAGLSAALITWARPTAPALPLTATLAVVLVLGHRRGT